MPVFVETNGSSAIIKGIFYIYQYIEMFQSWLFYNINHDYIERILLYNFVFFIVIYVVYYDRGMVESKILVSSSSILFSSFFLAYEMPVYCHTSLISYERK